MEYFKGKTGGKVIRQEEIAKGIMSLWVLPAETLAPPNPGQFYEIYPRDGAHLLGRPISLCDYDKLSGIIRFLYQVKGFGTTEFSNLSSGCEISLMGPLGNGFPKHIDGNNALLVGGGMGIAPLLYLAKSIKGHPTAVLGFRDEPLLIKEYEDAGCNVIIASESGNYGVKGNVIHALKNEEIQDKTIYSCGPLPMLKALVEYADSKNAETFVSLEERMACGIGVCLGCVTKDRRCTCKEGPVFKSSEVEL